MRLSVLKNFITIAEVSSFTKASERLFISQPALSRQIQDLESALEVQLFLRQKQALVLTAPGRRLLDEAREIVARADGLKDAVRQELDEVSGVLSISYQAFLDTTVMYRMMTATATKHPGIDFRLSRRTPPEIKQDLLFGASDVVFTLQACLRAIPHLECRRIAENRLQVAVPRGHRLAGRGSIAIEELADEDFIMLEHRVSPLTVDHVTGLCLDRGITPRSTSYVDNAETALFLVGIGKGISFVHSQAKLDLLDGTGPVVALGIEGLGDELDYVLASTANTSNPLVEPFTAELEVARAGAGSPGV